MTDILSAFCVGIAQTSVGHPFDTIKVLIQNNKSWKGMHMKDYYRGWKFPMTTSILFNCTVFPVYERTIDYTDSRLISGALAGIAVTPFVFCSEVGKIRQQTKQSINLNSFLKSRGRVSTLARETLAMSTYFGMYKYVREDLKFNPIIAGGIAGWANWTLTYPFDIIKSRQIAQNLTISDAIKIGNLWRGYPVCAFRAVIVNAVNFWTYETVKNILDKK
jgi:solute carrier family 25 carnitine/acylcarnitine transporter 20/29